MELDSLPEIRIERGNAKLAADLISESYSEAAKLWREMAKSNESRKLDELLRQNTLFGLRFYRYNDPETKKPKDPTI
ncbi:hypothetical protein MMC32_001540 [Xylographa parallela]|nr:hypothetical protein [Xylographa parallela]